MFKQLTHTEADTLITQGDVVVLDVRDKKSYETACIPTATHFSMSDLTSFCEGADKDLPVLIYCFHGISSQAVAGHLVEQGFTQVYSLIGGFDVWSTHHSASNSSL